MRLAIEVALALVTLGGDTSDGVALLALQVLVGLFLPFRSHGVGLLTWVSLKKKNIISSIYLLPNPCSPKRKRKKNLTLTTVGTDDIEESGRGSQNTGNTSEDLTVVTRTVDGSTGTMGTESDIVYSNHNACQNSTLCKFRSRFSSIEVNTRQLTYRQPSFRQETRPSSHPFGLPQVA